MQTHDSVDLTCPLDEIWDAAVALRTNLEQPRPVTTITGSTLELTIPVTLKVMYRRNAIEFKKFPTRRQLLEAAVAVRE